MRTPIDLTPAQWQDRAYVLDALRTRLGELVEASEAFGAMKERHRCVSYTPFAERDAANLRAFRVRLAVEDFVAAMHDHFAPIVPPPYPYPGSLDAFLAERHDLPMVNPWGVCGDAIDQGEGPEC